MSTLQNIAKKVRGKLKNLRARIVPAVIVMLAMMIMAVGF